MEDALKFFIDNIPIVFAISIFALLCVAYYALKILYKSLEKSDKVWYNRIKIEAQKKNLEKIDDFLSKYPAIVEAIYGLLEICEKQFGKIESYAFELSRTKEYRGDEACLWLFIMVDKDADEIMNALGKIDDWYFESWYLKRRGEDLEHFNYNILSIK